MVHLYMKYCQAKRLHFLHTEYLRLRRNNWSKKLFLYHCIVPIFLSYLVINKSSFFIFTGTTCIVNMRLIFVDIGRSSICICLSASLMNKKHKRRFLYWFIACTHVYLHMAYYTNTPSIHSLWWICQKTLSYLHTGCIIYYVHALNTLSDLLLGLSLSLHLLSALVSMQLKKTLSFFVHIKEELKA